MKVLAGDVGGTKTRLAHVEVGEGLLRVEAEADYRSADYPDLGAVARAFRERQGAGEEAVAFGVPGPVSKGRVRITNLPWEITLGALQHTLGLRRVAMINDLEATAYGIGELTPQDFQAIAEGDPEATLP